MGKKIKIAFDLDGVVARHSLGGIWVKIRLLKEKILKKVHTKEYYYPKTGIEKAAWKVINYLRLPNKEGIDKIRKMRRQNKFSFYLVTSRFKFNYPSTIRWLKKYRLLPLFEKVLVNVEDQDPIKFKLIVVKREGLNYFIDDDLEVLRTLCQTPAKLLWMVPRHRTKKENNSYQIKTCQSLAEALEEIASEVNGHTG